MKKLATSRSKNVTPIRESAMLRAEKTRDGLVTLTNIQADVTKKVSGRRDNSSKSNEAVHTMRSKFLSRQKA